MNQEAKFPGSSGGQRAKRTAGVGQPSRGILRFAALMVVAAVGAAGCDGPGAPEDESADEAEAALNGSEADVDAAHPDADRAHGDRMGRHHKGMKGGPAMLLHAALKKLDLTDAQRTSVEAALNELHDGREEPEGMADLAAQVRTGSVDAKAFAAQIAEGEARMAERRTRLVTALKTLHETLTPEQRKELVEKVGEKLDARAAKMEEHAGGKPERKHHKGGAGFFLHGLDVTDAQQTSIDAALAKAGLDKPAKNGDFKQQMMEKTKASLAAFAKDTFDAKAVVPEMGREHGPHLGRMVEALSVVVPLLDDAQRAKLAERIEQGPRHFEGKRGKHR